MPWHNINYAVSDLGPDKHGTAPPGDGCNGWDGFTFNRTLFPDPKRFFDKVHGEGIKMILSVHMQNGIDHCQEQYLAMAQAMGFSAAQIAVNETVNCTMDNRTYVDSFFKTIVDAPPVKGTADYWWLDYPGGASEISGWDQQEPASLYWSNRMFADHARGQGDRPVILARYGGLGQQRDGLGFSGDTFQAYSTLRFQTEMTPTASNVLFGWWSHDIGGNHNGGYSGYEPKTEKPIPGAYPGDEIPTNRTGSEMLLRWLQFGCFSPIFRTHCDPTCDRYVWHYPDFGDMRAAMRLRDALVPYIYTAGLHAYRTGVSLLRPMYYGFPESEEAYAHPGQYMFGDSILVSPVSSPSDNATGLAHKAVWLPDANATSWLNWDGTAVGPSPRSQWAKHEIPAFVQSRGGAGAIVPMRTANSTYTAFVDPLVWATWLPSPLSTAHAAVAELYEDAGDGTRDSLLLAWPNSSSDYTRMSSGREYEDPTNTAHATTEAALRSSEAGTVHLVVQPTSGKFDGQGETRQHVVQFRGRSAPKTVTVNGKAIGKIAPVAPDSAALGSGAGWFVSGQSADGRDNFTQPAGVLVVVAGRHSIREALKVTATW